MPEPLPSAENGGDGDDARVWLIRAGKKGEREPLALGENVTVIGWQDLGDISHLPSRQELKAMMAAHYGGKPQSVATQAGQIFRFQQEVEVGDLVVLPLKTLPGHIALGRIVGEFEYRTGPGYDDDANYVRPVEWLGMDLPYGSFDGDLVNAFRQQGTVSEINKGEDTAARFLAVVDTEPAAYHLVLKWSPKYGADTIQQHQEVIEQREAVWWGRVTTSPGSTGMSASRLADFRDQLGRDVPTVVFFYSSASVWKGRMLDIADDRADVDEDLVPPYYDPSTHYNLWVKVTDLEPALSEEIIEGFVKAANGQPVTLGGLKNQTPIILRDRVGSSQQHDPPKPFGAEPQPLTVAAVRAAAEAEDLVLDDNIYARVVAALESGKHVILTGPPGTAKTTLAMVIASVAKQLGSCNGYVLTTATSDWTTYETIGGLKPQPDQTLSFVEGHFLAAIRANEWLVIDELNRSNFDRAFGQLFTVLSGQPVVLPYTRQAQTAPLVLVPDGRSSPVDEADVLFIPKSWRVIATMNVFDKSLLFEMSFALMRRFAFIEVPPPSPLKFATLVDSQTADATAAEVAKSLLPLRDIKDMGPAVFIDVVRYAEKRRTLAPIKDSELAFELFYSYLLPQFEGITDEAGDRLFAAVLKVVGSARRERLRTTLNAVLGLDLPAPPSPTEDETEQETASAPADPPAE